MAAALRARRFHDGIESNVTKPHRDNPSGRVQGVKLTVYKHLLDINAGFDQAIRALAAIRKHPTFLARELDELSELAKEARAATNSYLIGVMETAETAEAGRRFGKRREREQREK